ncbi:MAG: hypothetical protein Q8K91_09225 [Hylemonella sp.]|nr:hypothetical protein [Hylemonella sp.]MDP1937370.1 hypothetical protein [Hylemonella sp.]
MSTTVVDTNVVLVANGQHADVSSECIATSALRLQAIMHNGKLALDDQFQILGEYLNKTQPKNGNHPGDAFVKWALQNRVNTSRVESVSLQAHHERGFESFPDDADLIHFDVPDRKFVAVSNAHPSKPPILQAADSKWLDWSEALNRYGVAVEFICPADITRFHVNKFGA